MKTLVLISAALVIAFAAYAAATDVRSGVWTADIKGNVVQMSIFPGRSEVTFGRGNWNFGNIIGFRLPLAKLIGLTGADGESKFTYRAAAGTIDFDGHFSEAQGAGHFRFTPSDEFVRDMAQLGYTEFKEESLLIYTVHELSPAIVRELKTMGYQPSRRELDDVAIFAITPDAIREFARLGYPNLSFRELVNLRVGNVDAEYIKAMKGLGYANLSAHEISDMAILGVSPDYVRDLRSAGLKTLSTREIRDLRVANITSKRIDEYRRAGYPNLTMRELNEFGLQHVTPDYIDSMRKAGFDNLSPRQLIEMRIFNITPDYIRQMNEIGVHDLRKMIELRQTGAGEILLKRRAK
jgi:hypothetical protein